MQLGESELSFTTLKKAAIVDPLLEALAHAPTDADLGPTLLLLFRRLATKLRPRFAESFR